MVVVLSSSLMGLKLIDHTAAPNTERLFANKETRKVNQEKQTPYFYITFM